jgi:hypothetical protein
MLIDLLPEKVQSPLYSQKLIVAMVLGIPNDFTVISAYLNFLP